jgi:hypothetical protein
MTLCSCLYYEWMGACWTLLIYGQNTPSSVQKLNWNKNNNCTDWMFSSTVFLNLLMIVLLETDFRFHCKDFILSGPWFNLNSSRRHASLLDRVHYLLYCSCNITRQCGTEKDTMASLKLLVYHPLLNASQWFSYNLTQMGKYDLLQMY